MITVEAKKVGARRHSEGRDWDRAIYLYGPIRGPRKRGCE